MFGFRVWAWPALSLHMLVLVFGIFAIAGGIFAILADVRAATTGSHRLLVEGVLGVLAGMVALGWPALTAVALLLVIAAWAIAAGIVEIVGAFRAGGGGPSVAALYHQPCGVATCQVSSRSGACGTS